MATKTLKGITIEGFKSIAALKNLELRRTNILIGANGSGKSNILQAFAFLQSISDDRLDLFVGRTGGAENILHFGSKTTTNLSIGLMFDDGMSYDVRFEPTGLDSLFCAREKVSVGDAVIFDKHGLDESLNFDDEPKLSNPSYLSRVPELVNNWRTYNVHDTSDSSPMRKIAKIDDNRYLRADGSNLTSFLFFLQKRHQASYGLIRRTIQKVAPFFLDFVLEPHQLDPDSIKLEWKHNNTDRYFNARSLSDGTLRFIALATLFLQPTEHRPSLMLVDEPELGLHPYAIGLLASMIQQAAVDTQVIVSTQSPLLLDYFEPEDVLVADCVDGATRLERLNSQRLEKWLEDYSLGQLWEKNEIGGRPGSI